MSYLYYSSEVVKSPPTFVKKSQLLFDDRGSVVLRVNKLLEARQWCGTGDAGYTDAGGHLMTL